MQDPSLGHSAVVAVTGRHVPQFQHHDAYQEVLQREPLGRLTKFHAKIETLDQMQHLMRQAFREATTGTPRPVHLDIAGLTGDALAVQEGEFDITVADEAHMRYPAFRPAPDPSLVKRAAEAIGKARRPVIVADRGVTFSNAESALTQLAERIQAAVVVTLDAKAAMMEDHPLFRGVVGLYGRGCANHVVDEADLVIFAGSNTSDHTTANFKLPRAGVPVIQIDQDPVELGRNLPGTLGLLADVGAGMEALALACARRSTPTGSARVRSMSTHGELRRRSRVRRRRYPCGPSVCAPNSRMRCPTTRSSFPIRAIRRCRPVPSSI